MLEQVNEIIANIQKHIPAEVTVEALEDNGQVYRVNVRLNFRPVVSLADSLRGAAVFALNFSEVGMVSMHSDFEDEEILHMSIYEVSK
jgi:hypothetical protein